MGKEQRTPGPTERTGKTVLDSSWSSPNRDHFYTERFARFSKLRESETKNKNANLQISNIYVEAKKHLSEMLISGEEDAESMMRSLPKSLGRISSLREYSSFSPGVKEMVKSVSCDNKEQTKMCEPRGSSNEDRSSESLELDLSEENKLSFSSSGTFIEPSVVCKSKGLEITPDKPSPISVLEPLFSDDDITPARTVSRPVEAAIQPLSIQFDKTVSCTEDQQIRITDSGDSEESAFEYVEAILLSSDLNWSEFEKRWISSIQILDPYLFDEVGMFSSRAKHDQKLLFDSANESLEEVCNRFIPESSVIKKQVCPVPKGMDLINEVWSRVEPCLCKIYPRDLGRLVRNDLETSKMWLDLRCGSREIVIEIEELIFEETVNETVSSLFNDCVDCEMVDDRMNNALSCS